MELLNLYGYLSVLTRALTLAFQSLVVGGVVFRLYVARPVPNSVSNSDLGSGDGRMLLTFSALGLIAAQLAGMTINSTVLVLTEQLSLAQLAGATFFVAGVVVVVSAGAVALVANGVLPQWKTLLAGFSVAILAGSLLESHAVSRVSGRLVPVLATFVHQASAAAWIGGLPYLLSALVRAGDASRRKPVLERFSRLAMVSVSALVSAGIMLSWWYIGSAQALYGTAYGAMTLTKCVLLAFLLGLGAKNKTLIQRLWKDRVLKRTGASPLCAVQGLKRTGASPLCAVQESALIKLRRFSEAEIGIGFTAILAAASLTSTPPAIDMTANRLTAGEIVQRVTPRWPRLSTPRLEDISPSSRQIFEAAAAVNHTQAVYIPGEESTPNAPGDIAWSEYNHHWAGLIVLVIGLLALVHRTGFARWSRHWPLLFLALGAFILLRADPEGWPLGPDSFLDGFKVADVVQHRMAVVLVTVFGIFEWRVRRGGVTAGWPALIFPAVGATGGAILITHSHALGNVREATLAEINHLTLAILSVAAGWTRWLELRLPRDARSVASCVWASWVWPICFVLIGLVLLDYREA
jgi:copper resistance protein D